MQNALIIIQIIIAFALSTAVLLQGGGSGLGSSWGGGPTGGGSFRSRRGMEKFLLYISGFLAVAFFLSSLANFLV